MADEKTSVPSGVRRAASMLRPPDDSPGAVRRFFLGIPVLSEFFKTREQRVADQEAADLSHYYALTARRLEARAETIRQMIAAGKSGDALAKVGAEYNKDIDSLYGYREQLSARGLLGELDSVGIPAHVLNGGKAKESYFSPVDRRLVDWSLKANRIGGDGVAEGFALRLNRMDYLYQFIHEVAPNTESGKAIPSAIEEFNGLAKTLFSLRQMDREAREKGKAPDFPPLEFNGRFAEAGTVGDILISDSNKVAPVTRGKTSAPESPEEKRSAAELEAKTKADDAAERAKRREGNPDESFLRDVASFYSKKESNQIGKDELLRTLLRAAKALNSLGDANASLPESREFAAIRKLFESHESAALEAERKKVEKLEQEVSELRRGLDKFTERQQHAIETICDRFAVAISKGQMVASPGAPLPNNAQPSSTETPAPAPITQKVDEVQNTAPAPQLNKSPAPEGVPPSVAPDAPAAPAKVVDATPAAESPVSHHEADEDSFDPTTESVGDTFSAPAEAPEPAPEPVKAPKAVGAAENELGQVTPSEARKTVEAEDIATAIGRRRDPVVEAAGAAIGRRSPIPR